MSYEAGIKREFLEAYSDDVQQDILRLLANCYESAHQDCRLNHARPEAHDLYPHKRRAVIEGQLRELAGGYPEITAAAELNSKGTSFYTLLASGNVLLTANAVEHPNVIIRRAAYRETYARAAQLKLFGDGKQPPGQQPLDGFLLYAILLHGPDPLNEARPGFVHIVFPDEDCTQYVTRINLFDRHASLVSELFPIEEEAVLGEPDIRLRPSAKEHEQSAGD